MPRRRLLLTLLAALGCTREPSFRDVQRGEVKLESSERTAVEEILKDGDLPARRLSLTAGDSPYLLVENGHVVEIAFDRELTRPAPFARLPRLRKLRLERASFANLDGFGPHPELESLSLAGWFSHVASLEGLEGCGALLELTVRGPLSSLAPLAGCGLIERLHVDGAALGSLESLPPLGRLRELALSSEPLTSLEGLEAQSAIERLTISDAASLKTLTTLAPLAQLRELSLYRAGLRSLDGTPALPQLDSLTIEDSRLSTLGDFASGGSSSWPRLRSLHLEGNQLEATFELARFAALEELRIAGNAITDLRLSSQPRLTEIDLRKNLLDNLQGLASQPNLEQLTLSENPLSDLTPLVEHPSLRYLDIRDTQVAGVPPELYERSVSVSMDESQVEANRWEEALREAWHEEGFVERLPGGHGALERLRGECSWSAGTFREAKLACRRSADSLTGFLWMGLIGVDPLHPTAGGPNRVRIRVELSVQEGTARVYVRDRIDFKQLAGALAGRTDRDEPWISFGDRRDPDDYRDGYRFAEAQPGRPATVSGEAGLLVDQWVVWLESVHGPARGITLIVDPN